MSLPDSGLSPRQQRQSRSRSNCGSGTGIVNCSITTLGKILKSEMASSEDKFVLALAGQKNVNVQ